MSESNVAVLVKTFSPGQNKFLLFFLRQLFTLLPVRVNICNGVGIFARLGLSLAKTSVENWSLTDGSCVVLTCEIPLKPLKMWTGARETQVDLWSAQPTSYVVLHTPVQLFIALNTLYKHLYIHAKPNSFLMWMLLLQNYEIFFFHLGFASILK